MRATNRHLCRIAKNCFFLSASSLSLSLLSLEMSPFSDMPTCAHLSSVNSKEWTTTRNPQALQTKPKKGAQHWSIIWLLVCISLKNNCLHALKSTVPATIDFPETLKIPGSMHKGGWSLEWAILINLQNSTRTCRCVYSNGEEKKNLS